MGLWLVLLMPGCGFSFETTWSEAEWERTRALIESRLWKSLDREDRFDWLDLEFLLKNRVREIQKSPGRVCRHPVAHPRGKGYYVAQRFGEHNPRFGGNLHLGEDWNAITGGNSDLGDPVFSACPGLVFSARHEGFGWGKVVRVLHWLAPDRWIGTVYGHLREMLVKPGQFIPAGQQVGTIGTAGGAYVAHLHFEVRDRVLDEIAGGYAPSVSGWLHPRQFLGFYRKD